MKSTIVFLKIALTTAIVILGFSAHAEDSMQKNHAAMEDCAKTNGLKRGVTPTSEQHVAMRKCLESKGIALPKPDPAREAAFMDCMKTAKIKEGEKAKPEQFGVVHECMEGKGFKAPMHGGMSGGMHPPMPPTDKGTAPADAGTAPAAPAKTGN